MDFYNNVWSGIIRTILSLQFLSPAGADGPLISWVKYASTLAYFPAFSKFLSSKLKKKVHYTNYDEKNVHNNLGNIVNPISMVLP